MRHHRSLANFAAYLGILSVTAPHTANAWTFTTIYSFTNSNPGSVPWGGVDTDYKGNIYGTLRDGGIGCPYPDDGCGLVFKLKPPSLPKRPTWTLTTLYRFQGGADGAHPLADTLVDAHGNVLGTTVIGGRNDGGTIYKINPNGKYVFRATAIPSIASQVVFGLTTNPKGGYYSAAREGGAYGAGSVFSISTKGTLKAIYSFSGNNMDGAPSGPVTVDRNRNIVGVDSAGTNGQGEVYRISPRDIKTSIYSFNGSPDGSDPRGKLYIDKTGNIFGVTSSGGNTNNGTIFKISNDFSEIVLHSFAGTDGANPYSGLIGDGRGNMYGTTVNGGSFNAGTVFKITSAGDFQVLHHFGSVQDDGFHPYGLLTFDSDGGLIGTTSNDMATANPAGTVFRLKP